MTISYHEIFSKKFEMAPGEIDLLAGGKTSSDVNRYPGIMSFYLAKMIEKSTKEIIQSNETLSKSNETLTKWIVGLTAIIALVGVCQIILSVITILF